MVWPPKTFTPRRLDSESRPFLVLPPAFLCAIVENLSARANTGYLKLSIRLAVALTFQVLLTPSELDDLDFLAPAIGSDGGRNLPAFHIGSPNLDIVAIGNHEVTTGIALPWGQAPFYEQIFAQENGKTFFTRNLGKNATLLVLDSGHMKTHSQQNDFIEDQLLIHKDTPHRLALYHAPLYPNHRDEFDALANAGKNNWLSLFDKHQLTSAFENHDHTLKRTHILKENSIADKGTVYVGDGCWGKNGRKSNPQKWYLHGKEIIYIVII